MPSFLQYHRILRLPGFFGTGMKSAGETPKRASGWVI